MGLQTLSANDLYDRRLTGASTHILDVRRAQAVAAKPQTIPLAKRVDHTRTPQWAANAGVGQHELIAVACVHGHNVSQMGAALLVAAGFSAARLVGGVDGWIEAAFPTRTISGETEVAAAPERLRCVVGWPASLARICALWILQRYVDADVEPLFVENEFDLAVADELGVQAILPGAQTSNQIEQLQTLPRMFAIEDAALAPTLTRCAELSDLFVAAPTSREYGCHQMLQQKFAVIDAIYAAKVAERAVTAAPRMGA